MNVPATQTPLAAAASESVTKAWLRALALTKPIASHPTRLLAHIVDELAERFGDKPALLSDHETFSFRDLGERARRYARWARAQGIQKGDVVGLLMPNRPEYLAIWVGITRVGGIVALLNTNLVGSSLAHAIDVVAPKHMIVAQEFRDAHQSVCADLKSTSIVWIHGDPGRAHSIEDCIDLMANAELPLGVATATTVDDCALYIYTSGTTGMPKAAKVTHLRLLTWSAWFAGMMDTRASDRLYNCLPMYHSVGGVVATGAVLLNGGSVALREKFSASEFWNDIARFECTLFQYIGELCRYLVHSPPHPLERAHRLRMCCGNGMQEAVWKDFDARFRIPRILEFYAATEGNVTLFNVEGKPGAIGRTPSFLAHRAPIALVAFDGERGEPIRNAAGFCVRCEAGQIGEALGRITDADGASGRFDGYTDRMDSERKVLRDVFRRGDAWYRTGDLMRKDVAGFYYFIDRVGETFRWHGENVSTAEVAAAISTFPGISDATVYGVTVPGTEGRAGMAALVSTLPLDVVGLRHHLSVRLPPYAQPAFLRVCQQIATTSTFKHRKNQLVEAGCNPEATSDPLYVNDAGEEAYVRLDRSLYQRIASGTLRL